MFIANKICSDRFALNTVLFQYYFLNMRVKSWLFQYFKNPAWLCPGNNYIPAEDNRNWPGNCATENICRWWYLMISFIFHRLVKSCLLAGLSGRKRPSDINRRQKRQKEKKNSKPQFLKPSFFCNCLFWTRKKLQFNQRRETMETIPMTKTSWLLAIHTKTPIKSIAARAMLASNGSNLVLWTIYYIVN